MKRSIILLKVYYQLNWLTISSEELKGTELVLRATHLITEIAGFSFNAVCSFKGEVEDLN
jgi:hypothetical protein